MGSCIGAYLIVIAICIGNFHLIESNKIPSCFVYKSTKVFLYYVGWIMTDYFTYTFNRGGIMTDHIMLIIAGILLVVAAGGLR